MPSVNTIQDVVSKHLCMGCGTCAAAKPDSVRMVDTLKHGRRPLIASDLSDQDSRKLAATCPGRAINAAARHLNSDASTYDFDAWGPVLEVWEGHATDADLRFRGSSGGVVSALSLFCLEQKEFEGAVQTRARKQQPLFNESVVSTTRQDVVSATASRYAPASPCERLADVKQSGKQHVFVGKPCDVAGAANLASVDPKLKENIGLSISIFCAGTPSTAATQELMTHLGVQPEDEIIDVRYRGKGWPGRMTVTYRSAKTGKTESSSVPYAEGWGKILQQHTQWRCRLCADHLGEHADLSVGDPWYKPIAEGDQGQSLILVRTERGRQILREAMQAGVLNIARRSLEELKASQPNLERVRGAVFARNIVARALGAAAPSYAGSRLGQVWIRALSPTEKLKSVTGTVKRLITKGLLRPEQAKIIKV